MISSIFYFADTEQEYLDNFNRRQVKPYTIVFCKDTHSVWKNGVRYGGSTSAETQSLISEIIDRDVAPLLQQLESAIQQANDATDRAEGRLSDISTQMDAAINDLQNAIDSEKARLDGKVDEINQNVEDRVQEILAGYQDLVDNFEDNVANKIESLLDDAEWVQQNIPQAEVTWDSSWDLNVDNRMQVAGYWDVDPETGEKTTKWSKLEQSVDHIGTEISELNESVDGSIEAVNTRIDQTADRITTTANSISNIDGRLQTAESTITQVPDAIVAAVQTSSRTLNGNIATAKSEAIQKASEIVSQVTGVTVADDGTVDTANTSLQQLITDEGNARAQLATQWANADADTKEVLEWMYSGLTTEAGDDKTFTELVAAAQDGDHSAISNITNLVEKVENEDGTFSYRAKSALTSAVDNALSGFISNTSSDYASALFFASLNDDIAGLKASTGDASALEGVVRKDSFAAELKAVASKDWAETTMATKLRVPKTYSNGAPMYDTQGNIIYEDVADVLGAMRTTIDVLDGGPQVTNSVDARVNDAISTFEQQVTGEAASTTAVNKLGPALSGLVSKVTGDTSLADIVSKINGMSAGLITTANLDSAVAGLVAENANSSLKSSIYSKIDAAKDEARSGMVANSTAGAAAIFAKANAQGSEIQLSADKINFTGSANFENAVKAVDLEIENTLTVGDVEDKVTEILESGDAAFSGDVYASSLTAGDTTGLHIVTTGNQLQFINGDRTVGRFVVDGLGLLLFVLNSEGLEYKIDWNTWHHVENTSFDTIYVYTFRYYSGSDTSGYPQRIASTKVTIYKDRSDGKYYATPDVTSGSLSSYKCFMPDVDFGGDDDSYYVWSRCRVYKHEDKSDISYGICPLLLKRYKEVTITGSNITPTGKYIYFTDSRTPKTDDSRFAIYDANTSGGWPNISGSTAYVTTAGYENEWYDNSDPTYLVMRNDTPWFEYIVDYTNDDLVYAIGGQESLASSHYMKPFNGSGLESLITTVTPTTTSMDGLSEYYT